jgi:hypothetical protein
VLIGFAAVQTAMMAVVALSSTASSDGWLRRRRPNSPVRLAGERGEAAARRSPRR